MTLLSLSHRHARTIPEPLRHLRRLIVVVSARTQRRSELLLVFRQPLNDHRGDALIHAEIRPAPSRVLFRKLSHHLQALLRRPCVHHRTSVIARTHASVARSFARSLAHHALIHPCTHFIDSSSSSLGTSRRASSRRASSRRASRTGIRANARAAFIRGHARDTHRRRRRRQHHRPRPRVRWGCRGRGRVDARGGKGVSIECVVSQRWMDGRHAFVTNVMTRTRKRERETAKCPETTVDAHPSVRRRAASRSERGDGRMTRAVRVARRRALLQRALGADGG